MCVTARTGADSYVNAQMVLLQQCGAIHNGLDMERWCVGLATCGVGLAMQDLAQLKSRRARGAVAESSTTAMPCLGGGAVEPQSRAIPALPVVFCAFVRQNECTSDGGRGKRRLVNTRSRSVSPFSFGLLVTIWRAPVGKIASFSKPLRGHD